MFRIFNVIKDEFMYNTRDYLVDNSGGLNIKFGSLLLGCDPNLLIKTDYTGVNDTLSGQRIYVGDYVVGIDEVNSKMNIVGEVKFVDGSYRVANEVTGTFMYLHALTHNVAIFGNRFESSEVLKNIDYRKEDLALDLFEELCYTSLVL